MGGLGAGRRPRGESQSKSRVLRCSSSLQPSPEGIRVFLPAQAYFLLSQGGLSDDGGQEMHSGYYSEGSYDMDEPGSEEGGVGAGAGAGEAVEFDDEAFARQLQQEEQRAMMAHLMAAQLAGMAGGYPGDGDEQEEGDELEDELDPDHMTYEQLTALGDVVGTQRVSVPQSTLAALAEVSFVQTADAGEEQCVPSRPHNKPPASIESQLGAVLRGANVLWCATWRHARTV